MFLAVLGATIVLLGGLLIWLRRSWALITVEGQSMAPTLRPGERVLVRRIAATSIRTGDMVVVERPVEGGWRTPPLGAGAVPTAARRWIVKRAIAGPGDPVPAELLTADRADFGSGAGEVTLVPPGHYVLLGDNRQNSVDSRIFGFVPGARILGPIRRGVRPT